MNLELGQKVALVTGASRGIGRAIAKGFLEEGANVVICARGQEDLEATRQAFADTYGAERIAAIAADTTSQEDSKRVVAQVISRYGALHAVVANVGSGSGTPGWELDERDWDHHLAVNLKSAAFVATAAMPHLIDTKGALTFISSITGWEATPAPLPYSAAKAALLNTTKNLAHQAGKHQVRVNAIAPGNILFPGGTWDKKLTERRAFFEDYIRSEVPLARFGTPEEIADAALFLCSARAAFITGACLVVDGGQTRSL